VDVEPLNDPLCGATTTTPSKGKWQKKNELKENSTNHGSGSGNVSPKRKPCQKAGKNPTKRGAHLHLPQGAQGRGGQGKAGECKKGG